MFGGEACPVPMGEVDIAERNGPGGAGEEDGGQTRTGEQRGQRVVGVGGDDERAVGTPLPQVGQHLVPGLRGLGEHQQGMHRPRTQVSHDTADDASEEGVREHPCGEGVLLLPGVSPAPDTIRATVWLRRVTSDLAARLGAYPVRSMASRTTS